MLAIGQMLTENSDRPPLTSQEQVLVKDRARWLRRVVNPFADFNIIVTIGTITSSSTGATSQRENDPDAQDYLKDLWVSMTCLIPQ